MRENKITAMAAAMALNIKPYNGYIPVMLCIGMYLAGVSCDNDNGNDIAGPIEDMSFQTDVAPIFSGSCGGAGCHVGSSQSGVNLTSYQQVMNSSGQQYGRPIVQPGEPGDSPLVDKIGPEPEYGQRMPMGRAPLNNSQIQVIRVWIEEGAINN